MRIEINLAKEVASAIDNVAKANNHSRKSYIEWLCIQDVRIKPYSKMSKIKNKK